MIALALSMGIPSLDASLHLVVGFGESQASTSLSKETGGRAESCSRQGTGVRNQGC